MVLTLVSIGLTSCIFPRFRQKPQEVPGKVTLPVVSDSDFASFDTRVFRDPGFPEVELPPKPTVDTTPLVIIPDVPLPEGGAGSVVRSDDTISFCRLIDSRLSSVSFRHCLAQELRDSSFRTTGGQPIFYAQYSARSEQKPLGKILVLGGVHGDELTSVSTTYLWMQNLKRFHSGLFDWRVVPLVNPDGFFRTVPTRTNANGVDLNRNMPTYQWWQLADRYWKSRAGGTERKFPGRSPASEAETRWLVEEIESYDPDVIISVHAPYNLVDFDAVDRSSAPRQLGILRGKSLGTFPGSLGRYAGEERNIPTITLELPHSTRMPRTRELDDIWLDLVSWLRQNVNSSRVAGRSFSHCDSLRAEGCI